MLDRSFIGHKFDAHTVEIEKGRLRFFAKAIGETNPIYFDEAAARDRLRGAADPDPRRAFRADAVTRAGSARHLAGGEAVAAAGRSDRAGARHLHHRPRR